MGIKIKNKEADILLGATLMHWGVPFRFTTKLELTENQQNIIEAASDKLISLRELYHETKNFEGCEADLSAQEIALLAEVGRACLAECGNDLVELELQLKTRSKSEVESLLSRLISPIAGRQPSLTT
jgi:hypothetical protein